jgi:uncharacterized repeat protein (TIGR03803 family)
MKTNDAKRFLSAAGVLAVAVFGGNILAQAQTLTTIHSFTGKNGDGQEPFPQHLTFDSSGAVYGTTVTNGSPYWGTVFQLVPPTIGGGGWKENVLYDFQGWYPTGDGAQPQAGVVFDQNSNLYGTTDFGGNGGASGGGAGTIFELSPPAQQGGAWKESVIYTFGGRYDGWYPGEVTFGPNGSLYGTTQLGGTARKGVSCLGNPARNNVGCGTVFELTPPAQPGGSWTKTILHNFPTYAGDGLYPSQVVTFDTQGNLYGTAGNGGSNGYGMVFQLTPPASGSGAWTQTVLHNFTGGSDGEYPGPGLTLGPNGVLYGSASNSGYYGTTGIVFQLTPPSGGSGAWTETVLSAGPTPASPLAIDPSGNLYGTTISGGSKNCGIVFKLAPPSGGGAWTETVLHNWPCANAGGTNESRVVYHNGLLYGTTTFLGSANLGQVFTLVP